MMEYIKPYIKYEKTYFEDILVVSLNDEGSLGFELEEGDEVW